MLRTVVACPYRYGELHRTGTTADCQSVEETYRRIADDGGDGVGWALREYHGAARDRGPVDRRWQGRVLIYSAERFLREVVEAHCCFNCGASPGSVAFNDEHV